MTVKIIYIIFSILIVIVGRTGDLFKLGVEFIEDSDDEDEDYHFGRNDQELTDITNDLETRNTKSSSNNEHSAHNDGFHMW